MELYQQRVIMEEEELSTKVLALRTFILGNPRFQTVAAQEKARLAAQLSAMQQYQAILRERIFHFDHSEF